MSARRRTGAGRVVPAFTLALALGPWAGPGPAAAAGDGGTESIFARGAGSRALALGGAFVAQADDATGWMWNPAGLGLTQRAGFQIDHALPGALDYRESFAGAVVPNWRWGTLAFGYRQFAVDGIEARDERNQLLEGDLSDRQSEFALAYGLAPSGTWSFGGVARVRRHELAGRSANSIGADLGLLIRPAQALGAAGSWAGGITLGVVARNVVQPATRLDVEEVTDPRGTRLGVSVLPRLPGGLPARLEIDLDVTEGRSTRLHGGFEVSAHPMLDLRAGLNADALTAGTGLRLGRFALDYAFEDNAVAPAHRVSVGMQFGLSTDESRAQAKRRRDDELEQRLARTFEERRVARVNELLAEAEGAWQAGDADQALDILVTLRTLEPGDGRAAALEASILLAQARRAEAEGNLGNATMLYARSASLAPGDTAAAAGMARCRAAEAQRAARSAEVQRGYAEALEAFLAGDLARAQRGFTEVLAARPEDRETRDMLQRVERALGQRVEQMVSQASRLIQVGAFDDAQGLLDQARALNRPTASLDRAQAALTRARQAARAETTAPARRSASQPGPRAVSEQDRLEADRLWKQGQDAMQAGRVDEAMRYWELVRAKNPAHARARQALRREYLARGMDAFASGRLPEAIAQWESALRIDPSDERARAYLARAQEHLARTSEIRGR